MTSSIHRNRQFAVFGLIWITCVFIASPLFADVNTLPPNLDFTKRQPDLLGLGFDSAPKAAKAVYFQDRLLALAKRYAKLDYVPYIWGGGNIGNPDSCQKCRECVVKNKVPLVKRLSRCSPCQRCGIDCSHFVYKMYQEAGLRYNYASSWELSRQSGKGLLHHYNMVDIGRDLSLAQPGDLLVFRKHIMMLVRIVSGTRGDFVHVTRFRNGDWHKLGGLRLDTNRDILNFRGQLVRILRHKQFFDEPNSFSKAKPFPLLYDQLIANL